MKKFMGWYVLLVIFCIGGCGNEVSATNGAQVWAEQTGVKVREVPASALPADSDTCSGTMMPIETKSSDGTTMACVFGGADGLRLARLREATGQFIYAVAYPTAVKYAVIRDFCISEQFCAYGQAEDTALVQGTLPSGFAKGHVIVQHFSKHLTPYSLDDRYVQYLPEENPAPIATTTQRFATSAVAVSPSGRWAVVELQAYGLVRIDLRTLHMQRIRAPGIIYGLGADPRFELAITNDGSKVVSTGMNSGVDIYEVSDNCGDDLSKGPIERYFSAYVMRCKQAYIDPSQLIPGFHGAQRPHFSADGTRLSLFVPLVDRNIFVTLVPNEESLGDNGEYIAFGDSFTSGEGELSDTFYIPSTNTTTNRCHVSTRSYPFLMGKWWELPTLSYACSGSQIPDIMTASSAALGERSADGRMPRLISLGVGGNDVDLVGKLKSCLGIGTCEWARPERRTSTAEEIRALFPKVVELITKLKNDYAQPPLLVVGYARVINTASMACNTFVSVALTPDERRYFDESIMYVNQMLEAAAQSTHTTYVDIEDALVGERLCDVKETAMNTVRLGGEIAPLSFLENMKIIGAESFHPTPRGHQLIAQKIQTTLENFWQSPYCDDCRFESTLLTPSSYWTDATPPSSLRQVARQFMYAKELQTHAAHLFAFLAGTFQPGVKVRIELHSNPIQLGEYIASEDGSLEGSVKIPDIEEGYHTVHAIVASSQEGAENVTIDRYETVYITTSPHAISKPTTERIVSTNNTLATPQGQVEAGPSYVPVEPLESLEVLGAATQPIVKSDKGARRSATPPPLFVIAGIGCTAFICLAIILWLIWAQRGETGEK